MSAALSLVGALAALGAIVAVLRARRIAARHRAAFGGTPPRVEGGGERLVDAPRALYHGTRFADGTAVLAPRWSSACVADLWCTAQGIFLCREDGGEPLAIPLAAVEDASLVRAYAKIAGKDLPMLRVRWRRGGEALETGLSLPGGMANLEKLRREIHLRQGQNGALSSLLPFLERARELGK